MKSLSIEAALSNINKAAARSTSKDCGPFPVFTIESHDGAPEGLPPSCGETDSVEHAEDEAQAPSLVDSPLVNTGNGNP